MACVDDVRTSRSIGGLTHWAQAGGAGTGLASFGVSGYFAS
jgi:hypothetical protein